MRGFKSLFGKGASSRRSSDGDPVRQASAYAVESLEARTLLSAGQLDATFGKGGIVQDLTLPTPAAVAVQQDGKIVESGLFQFQNGVPAYGAVSVARFNADGSTDTSFGYFGHLTTAVNFGPGEHVSAMKIQADGKIVVAMSGAVFGTSELIRYNPDGQLDNSFGTNGTVGQFFNSGTIAIQADGKILVSGTGYSQPYSRIVRYNPNGTLDNTFGSGGVASTASFAFAVFVVQADQKIIVDAGGLYRLNPNGSVDAQYNASDQVLLGRQQPGLALQSDGKLLVFGNLPSPNLSSPNDPGPPVVVRYNTDGSRDAAFGPGGEVLLGTSPTSQAFSSGYAQPDGKIVVGGNFGPGAPTVSRLNANGTPDTSFGNNGVASTTLGSPYDGLASLVAGPGGTVIAAGLTFQGSPLGIVRLTGDGAAVGPIETPFGGAPAPVPGRIEAENFDNGGEGLGYHSSNPVNFTGNLYRASGVSVENSGDNTGNGGGGYNVGFLHAGDYLRYTIAVAANGAYDFTFRVSNVAAGGTFHVQVDGVNSLTELPIPNTGGYQTYANVPLGHVVLGVGTHVITIVMDSNNAFGYSGNFNYIQVVPSSAAFGSIAGTVYSDFLRNGVHDPSEAGIPDRQVYLDLPGIGHFVAGDPVAVTDANGHYQFTGLSSANYLVRLVPQAGQIITSPVFGGVYFVQLGVDAAATSRDFGTLPVGIPNITLADGSILAATRIFNPPTTMVMGLTHYNADGSTDALYGVHGLSVLPDPDVMESGITSIHARPDGNVVTALAFLGGSNIGLTSPSGALLHDITLSQSYSVAQLAVQPDNKVVVTAAPFGTATPNAVSRYNADLTPDFSFGVAGSVIVPVPAGYIPTTLTLLPGGNTQVIYASGALHQTVTLSPTGAIL